MEDKTSYKDIIEAVGQVLREGWYDQSPSPDLSRSNISRDLGRNPLFTDNGNHSNADRITQPSTVDFNGASFRGKNYIISDNMFMIYKIKNFGHDRFAGTMNMFASTKDFRAALDRLNGGARRGGRSVIYRSFTSQSKANIARRNDFMSYTFWEFSLDNGKTWNVMRPNPLENMQPSKMVVRPGSVIDENKKNKMAKKTIQMKRSEFTRYVNESVRKVLNEIGNTPQGQHLLGRLQAKKQKEQGSKTGENDGYGHYNSGEAGKVGAYADKQQKNSPNRNQLASAHADGFNAQWKRQGEPLRMKRSGSR